ncbi:MAG: FIST C-terminal domain-containing protein [Spirochaetaceae bacterium]|nr:FIST C-terminal domain-containing protein [Spirochaetaceae bacterium]
MIKTMTAFTFEVDDPAVAAAEITGQINMRSLRKSSLGILTCYTDFIDSGVVRAVCAALPFDVIGITTGGTAVPGAAGELMFGLMVLTSDDVDFVTGTAPIGDKKNIDGPIRRACREAWAKHPGAPALMIPFVPYINDLSGEVIALSLDKAAEGVPLFGSLAIDSSADYSLNRTIYNGEPGDNRVVFALLYGDVHPSFFVSSVSEDKIQKQRGVITKSKENILMEVNNMPVLDYLQSIGIHRSGGAWAVSLFPFVINYNDGTKPVVRSLYLLTKEGYAACGGNMPENATLSVGSIDYADIVRTTSETLNDILKKQNSGGSCLLMFSCLTRYFALEAHASAEMDTIQNTLADSLDYIFSYSGGEICPAYIENGSLVNRFYNCTFIACLL